jgi:RNA polymerase sigma-70 factor, ECF subfamily
VSEGLSRRPDDQALDPVPVRDSARPEDPSTARPEQDAELVAAVLRGDAEAVERFIVRMRCVPRILAALNLREGRRLDRELISDLEQDTMVVVWRKLAEFHPGAPLESWSYGIAYLEYRNACRRSARAKQIQVPLAGDPPAVVGGGEHEGIGIEEALELLERDDARVIRLRHEENLTFEAIGAQLGMPMNTAKSRYHRGLKRLREALHARLRREEHPR